MNIDEAMEKAQATLDEAAAPETAVEPEAAPAETTTTEARPDAPASEEKAAAAPQRVRDESGRFKPKDAKAPEKPAAAPRGGANGAAPAVPAADQGKAVGAEPPAAPTAAPVPSVRAPQSWTPAEREAWGKVPAEAQAAIARREREIATTLQETAPVRQFASQVQQSLAPYESIARANGMDAMTFAGSALQNIAAIYAGAPQQAVSVVAGAVQMLQQRFGPQALDMINAAMEGKAVPQGAPQPQQPPRDPRVDGLLAQLEQAKAQRFESMLATFAETHDFYPDVRADMADLIDVWGKQGRIKGQPTQHDLERAYDFACRAHPEVSKALEQRKAAEAARTASAATQAARAAGVSLKSSPTAPARAQSKGIDGALEAARAKLGL